MATSFLRCCTITCEMCSLNRMNEILSHNITYNIVNSIQNANQKTWHLAAFLPHKLLYLFFNFLNLLNFSNDIFDNFIILFFLAHFRVNLKLVPSMAHIFGLSVIDYYSIFRLFMQNLINSFGTFKSLEDSDGKRLRPLKKSETAK